MKLGLSKIDSSKTVVKLKKTAENGPQDQEEAQKKTENDRDDFSSYRRRGITSTAVRQSKFNANTSAP